MPLWNPWTKTGKTSAENLPVRKNRQGGCKLPSCSTPVLTCTEADFLSPESDPFRGPALLMMAERKDLTFVFFTEHWQVLKDTEQKLPSNVRYYAVLQTEDDAKRLGAQLQELEKKDAAPYGILIRQREEKITPPLTAIRQVLVTGDQGGGVCDFDLVRCLKKECESRNPRVPFAFLDTGAAIRVNGKVYHIGTENRITQAKKAGLNSDDAVLDPVLQMFSDSPRMNRLFERLSCSGFRAGFSLSDKDRDYVREKGMDTIRSHAEDFVEKRLAPKEIANDGKQTPMRGHPVFPAQHATACCCRSCLEKWHGIPQGRELTKDEQSYIVSVLMEWIRRQMLP